MEGVGALNLCVSVTLMREESVNTYINLYGKT